MRSSIGRKTCGDSRVGAAHGLGALVFEQQQTGRTGEGREKKSKKIDVNRHFIFSLFSFYSFLNNIKIEITLKELLVIITLHAGSWLQPGSPSCVGHARFEPQRPDRTGERVEREKCKKAE